MDTKLKHPSERLDPLVLGVSASAPLADATRRALLAQQTACAAVETAEKMAERARLMFTTLENGPHPPGMLSCRLTATNGLLELVSKAAHTIWTSHRSEIRAVAVWPEEPGLTPAPTLLRRRHSSSTRSPRRLARRRLARRRHARRRHAAVPTPSPNARRRSEGLAATTFEKVRGVSVPS